MPADRTEMPALRELLTDRARMNAKFGTDLAECPALDVQVGCTLNVHRVTITTLKPLPSALYVLRRSPVTLARKRATRILQPVTDHPAARASAGARLHAY